MLNKNHCIRPPRGLTSIGWLTENHFGIDRREWINGKEMEIAIVRIEIVRCALNNVVSIIPRRQFRLK